MPPPYSFVIPVLNEAAHIAGLLQELRRCYPACELIVVDGGSNDATVELAMPRCDQMLLGERGRACQMNLGARVARGDYLCFLHADSVPGASAEQLQNYLAGHPQWGFCRVRLSGQGPLLRIIEWFMNQRSRLTAVATGDQMLILQRLLFEQTGGFERIPLMEDVAYCKRLRRRAAPVIVQQPIVTSSRRWEEAGVWRTVWRMWGLRLAYFLGVSPQTLGRYYRGV